MNPRKTDTSTPDWKLERYLLGELDPEELGRIRQDVENNESLRLRLEALTRSDRDIHERYPAAWMRRQIRRKTIGSAIEGHEVETRLWSRLWPMPAVPVGAMVAVLLALLVLPDTLTRLDGIQEGRRVVESTRIKGLETQLHLFRKTATGSEPLQDGAVAREHDLVLIQYRAAAGAYGVIVSVDGRGTVTRHLPSDSSRAARLQKNGIVSLDFAYELDDAPRWEKFYLVTSASAFDVDVVVEAARRVGISLQGSAPGDGVARSDSLDLSESFEQLVFTLSKETSDEN